MRVNSNLLTSVQEEPKDLQRRKSTDCCIQLLGRVCADWGSPLACTLFIGGTALAVYAFVTKQHLLGSFSTVAANVGGILYFRLACLASNGHLAENTSALGRQVLGLSSEDKKLAITLEEGNHILQAAKINVEEMKTPLEASRKQSEEKIKDLNNTVVQFRTALEQARLMYVSLKVQYEQMQEQVRSQVEGVSKVTSALATTNESIKSIQSTIESSQKEQKEVTITIRNTHAVEEFKAQNATMEELIVHLGQSTQKLIAVNSDFQKLEQSLKELVKVEGLVSSQGEKKLQELSGKLEELESLIAEKSQEALEIEKELQETVHV